MKANVFYDELGKDVREEEIPEGPDFRDLAQEYHEKLLEAVSDQDDEIMELFLNGDTVPVDKLRAAIRKATIAVQMVPVTCGTSYKNKGVQELLDAIVDFMPSPLDKKGIAGVNPKTDEEDFRPADDNAPFSASGLQDRDRSRMSASCASSAFTPAALEQGLDRSELHEGHPRAPRAASCRCTPTTARTSTRSTAGDIAAVGRCEEAPRRATRSATRSTPIILESMEFPEPVIRVAIEPKTKAGAGEDGHRADEAGRGGSDRSRPTPTTETGQTIIAGMGELHLEIIVDRLLREFKVEANVGAPQVAYKETVQRQGRRGHEVRPSVRR